MIYSKQYQFDSIVTAWCERIHTHTHTYIYMYMYMYIYIQNCILWLIIALLTFYLSYKKYCSHTCGQSMGYLPMEWLIHHAINRGSYVHKFPLWGMGSLYISSTYNTQSKPSTGHPSWPWLRAARRSRGTATTKGSSRIKAKFCCWGRSRKHACQPLWMA